MTQKLKVIAAGHICLDITPVFPEKSIQSMSELVPGKLIHMNGVQIHTGGSAANTGLAMKLLGADVHILGKVGADDFGRIVKASLESRGITKGLITDEHSATSYTVVLAVPGIDRIFLHDPGANNTYRAEDISDEELEDARLFHFGYPPLMKRMYQNGGEELEKLLRRVKEKGIPVSLDLAAVDPQSDAGSADWKAILKKCMPYVDIFVPSIEELLFMMDREKYGAVLEKAAGRDVTEILSYPEDVRPLGEALLEWGAGIVLIKCGKAGLYLACAGKERLEKLSGSMDLNVEAWAGRRLFEKSYQPEKVCSATGAGDTCIAAFLIAALLGRRPEECARLAAAEGASCVEAYDSLSGLRTLEQLEEKIAAGWAKNESCDA